MVTKNYLTKNSLHKGALKLAEKLATLPANAVQGTKQTINYGRDHSVAEGLEQIAKLNSCLLMSDETTSALAAVKQKLQKK
jgi:enoyl-CoA hydratase